MLGSKTIGLTVINLHARQPKLLQEKGGKGKGERGLLLSFLFFFPPSSPIFLSVPIFSFFFNLHSNAARCTRRIHQFDEPRVDIRDVLPDPNGYQMSNLMPRSSRSDEEYLNI